MRFGCLPALVFGVCYLACSFWTLGVGQLVKETLCCLEGNVFYVFGGAYVVSAIESFQGSDFFYSRA